MTDEKPPFPPVDLLTVRGAAAMACLFEPMASLKTGVGRWCSAVLFGLVCRQLDITLEDAGDGPIEAPLSEVSADHLAALAEFFSKPEISHPETAEWIRELVAMLNDARYAEILQRLEWQQFEHDAIIGHPGDTGDLPPWSEVSRPADED